MANDAKLGLFAGIAVMLIVGVFFGPRSAVGPAFINGDTAPANAPPGTANEAPSNKAVFPDAGTHSVWQSQPPRDVKPVSRDPLLWP